MIAIAVFVAWISYTAGFWGLSLVKGWNLSLGQIVSPTNWYGKNGQPWPPPLAGNTVIIPNGTASSQVTAALTAATTTSATTGTGGSSGGSTSGGVPAGTAPNGVSNKAAISMAAKLLGWGSGQQWTCLLGVIADESGGNPLATNPTSGAFGIAQALDHGTAGSAGCGRNMYGANYGLTTAQASQANCGNAYYQAVWMMNYIKETYGSPCAALAHENQYHWY